MFCFLRPAFFSYYITGIIDNVGVISGTTDKFVRARAAV